MFYQLVFKKNDMDWLQQPLQEEYQISVDNSEKPERITRHILGLFEFFSKKATFKLSLMAYAENKFLPIFQILDIKNVSFLLKLEMALASTIRMKFEPV